MKRILRTSLLALCLAIFSQHSLAETPEAEVAGIERAFAESMAERDFEAFSDFIDDEAVFFSGTKLLKGKEQVTTAWKAYFEGEEAPFSREPERVVVLPSGTLAHSSGPVRLPDGKLSGYYNSIWRKNADGKWKVVFDKGQPACDP